MPPAQRGAFVAHREEVWDVYQRPDDPQRPMVCLDEPPVPLMKEVRPPLPAAQGKPERDDDAYESHGTANSCMFPEPRRGLRTVSVREHKTAIDWATEGPQLLDLQSPEAERRRLVGDNLHTHGMGSLSEAFPPEQARRLASRLEIHPTPKPGSWLQIAEIALRALTIPCLHRRLPDLETLINATTQWEKRRHASSKGVDWQFSTHDASVKLKRLYPQMQS
jgi:DDE superfamily endonuclease